MPITAIPFKSPAPFELPPSLIETLNDMSLPAAVEQVESILLDAQCADVVLSALVDATGHLRPGPHAALAPQVREAMQAVAEEMAQRAIALDSEAGRQDFMGQAVHAGQPLLMMGEVAADEPSPLPTALRDHLLGGQERAHIGFMYVFPVKDAEGRVHGVLALHRAMASGPLNHDQPAITHSLVLALAERAGQLAKQV